MELAIHWSVFFTVLSIELYIYKYRPELPTVSRIEAAIYWPVLSTVPSMELDIFWSVLSTVPSMGLGIYRSVLSTVPSTELAIYWTVLSTVPSMEQDIPDKIRNATCRTDQLSGRSQVMGQFLLYRCKGMSGTAALHIVCNQASKCVQENWSKTK